MKRDTRNKGAETLDHVVSERFTLPETWTRTWSEMTVPQILNRVLVETSHAHLTYFARNCTYSLVNTCGTQQVQLVNTEIFRILNCNTIAFNWKKSCAISLQFPNISHVGYFSGRTQWQSQLICSTTSASTSGTAAKLLRVLLSNKMNLIQVDQMPAKKEHTLTCDNTCIEQQYFPSPMDKSCAGDH